MSMLSKYILKSLANYTDPEGYEVSFQIWLDKRHVQNLAVDLYLTCIPLSFIELENG